MKIAICIGQSQLGGVGTSTHILATWLRKAGHEADIIVTHFNPGSDYKRACDDGWPIRAINIGERWLRRRLENTICFLYSYDAVINNHSLETSLVLPALPTGIVKISVVRSTDNPVILKAKNEAKYVDALVGISPQVTELLCQDCTGLTIKMIPNSIILETDGFSKLEVPLRIVYLGRLEKRQKNVLILPEIANELNRLGLNFSMQVVGDGPDRDALQGKIRTMELDSKVQMLGGLKRSAAWNVLKKSHFSIVPSIFEGFGLVVAESMAAGVVPVCSNIDVFRWLLGEHSDLLTVSTHDPEAYATRIKSIADDRKQYRQLQVSLKARQKELFSPKIMIKNYLDMLNELSNKRDEKKHPKIDYSQLPLSKYHRRRCSRFWKLLQQARYGMTKI